MAQLEHIEALEKRLWSAADTLRANSNYASNEYFLPVMGLVFLRHAYSRFLAVKDAIEARLPKRGGKTRELAKEDFSQKSAIFLRPKAQFDYLVALPDSEDRAKAIIAAMEAIEADYENLRGVLPKGDYQELDNNVLGQLLRTLNPDELKRVSGDVFGRIYEYFLTQFADQKAHDDGEFFTPISLVSLIAHVLEPERGTVLDPACGSGGMFVQSARIVEERGQSPTDRLTFRGLEKNATTIRLAKMNLAVHGLEGDIQKAITYYEDPHELLGKADYVMANPPFNVDEIDADKVKNDPRLPFGLPGVNKKDKVSNGNYVWISYCYSYLSDKGRAGFVMSSQASSAGRDEAKVRQKLVETGDVDVMIAIRSNFFYTRTVPCELWFLSRNKSKAHRDKVLMLDARSVYRKVTRKIYDFSPEQQQNLLAIVWLYRGDTERFLGLVARYLRQVVAEGQACFEWGGPSGLSGLGGQSGQAEASTESTKSTASTLSTSLRALPAFVDSLQALADQLSPFLKTLDKAGPHAETLAEFQKEQKLFAEDVQRFQGSIDQAAKQRQKAADTNVAVNKLVEQLAPVAETSRDLIKQSDLVYKLGTRLVEICENECGAKESDAWVSRDVIRARKGSDACRQTAVEQLKQVRYFWRQAHWLTERFPEGKLRDVEGLVKLVDKTDLPSSERKEGAIPIVSSSGITGRHNTAMVEGPGVVTGRYGTLGEVFFVNEDFWPLNTALYVRDFKGNDPRFTAYFLQTVLRGTSSDKAAVPGVNRNDLHARKIRVTRDTVEQRAIADILSAYDDLIENNRRRIQLLEQAARLLYKEWFVHLRFPGHEHVKIIGGVPEGWERKTLTEIAADVSYGLTASSSTDDIGPKFLRITDIVPTIIEWDQVPFCEADDQKIQQNRLEIGDVVVARTGATVGYAKRISHLPAEAVFASYLVRFRFHEPEMSLMVGIYMESTAYKDFVKNHAGGAAQPNANAKVLGSAPLLLPPCVLRQQLSASVTPLINQRDLLVTQNERLAQARDLLLPRLMNGEISV